MTDDRRQLNQFIVNHFTDEELRILCAVEFRAVYDDFSDSWGKKRKVMELIGWCERNAQEEKLLAVLQRERPRPFRTVFGQTAVTAEAIAVPVGERNPRQIFISYAHQDAELAQRLAADLRANGWQTWIAPDSIQPGEQWVEAINRGLDESGIFLVLLTPDAVNSKWVKRETNIAVSMEHEGEVAFFPLDVKPCRPPALWRGYQFISFKNEYRADVSHLLKLLAGKPIVPQHLWTREGAVNALERLLRIKSNEEKTITQEALRFLLDDPDSQISLNAARVMGQFLMFKMRKCFLGTLNESIPSDWITILSVNIYFMLGVEAGDQELKDKFLKQIVEVVIRKFLDEEITAILSSEQMKHYQKIENVVDASVTEDQEIQKMDINLGYLEKFIPNLSVLLLNNCLKFKVDLLNERLEAQMEYFAKDKTILMSIERAQSFYKNKKFYEAVQILNSID